MFEQTTRREKILVFGSFKTGKSFLWLDLANTYWKSGNLEPTFYVIDTDFGVGKMLDEGYQHLEDDGMLKVYNPMDFTELMEASRDIYKKAKRGDWIVIDMINYPWEEAQTFYTNNVFGDNMENYFVQMRKEVVAKDGHDKRSYGGYEGTDWGFITKIYKQFEFPLTMKSLANVFGVTEERKLDGGRGDSPDKLKQFKAAGGMAPVGQKGIGHRFDTIARMTRRTNGQRQLTIVGDKGREESYWAKQDNTIINIDEPPRVFARRYLVDVAGWTDGEKKPTGSKPRTAKEKATDKPQRRRR